MSKNKTVISEEAKTAIKQDIAKEDFDTIQDDLLRQRRIRITVMSLLLSAVVLSAIYGTLENPFQYTLSMIGNRFTYRAFFIVWGIFTGVTIQISIVALFRLEHYPDEKKAYPYVILATSMLVLTAIVPALGDEYPVWHTIHVVTAVLHALFVLLALYPFTRWISSENPRLRLNLRIWQWIIWGVSLTLYIILGNTGIFEIWFFGSVLVYLLYLSLTLFEEKIVKQSVELLRNEIDLNQGIEKIFIRLQDEKND